ncbi:MAG: anthranilate synthase component I [Candidatus Omnitrophota bacterium]|nr:MAG: anthranilate synthase component I [Candidatus Omnitrophota bacterium]
MDISPTLSEFKRLAKNHNLIVLSYKFYCDWLTPLSTYHNLSKVLEGESFLLESVEGEEKICRFSFLGFMPIYNFRSEGRKIYFKGRRQRTFYTTKHPLAELKKIMDNFKVAPMSNLRFFGGFVGYLGYDIIRFYEPIGKELPHRTKTPDTYLILPKFLIIFDHVTREIEILSFMPLNGKKRLNEVYRKERRKLKSLYQKMVRPHELPPLLFADSKCSVHSNFKKSDFLAAVRKAKKYIKEGEIIQVVLSQRFSLEFRGNPFTVYRYLRMLNPSPYMFYLNFKNLKLCGSSPEMLLRCEKGSLITRPIAGTRKRGQDERGDQQLEASLLRDPKERAEHIMLVDLARNDVGRVAQKATVEVPIFMTVEKFSHVMHIVSEVRGQLASKEDIFSALIGCFPAGTVTGAPKVRAMQIINELEPDQREIYAGCVGYFSFTKSLDTCIIIRTIVFKDNNAYVQAGAGIVNDSVPQREYKETVNKAKAAVYAIRLAAQKK